VPITKFTSVGVSILLTITAMVSGCAHPSPTSTGVTLRLGYLTRITHASALVAVEKGLFADNLAGRADLAAQPFSRGTDEVTALLAGRLDAAYVGPNPAINAWQKSGGTVKIISGSATGGTSLVVKPEIGNARDLIGKTVADPALGGTQDVSLRSWLKGQGITTNTEGGGEVSVKPTTPESAYLQLFQTDQIAGALVSAPYDVELVKAGGTRLWSDPGTITVLVVRQEFLDAHPDAVRALLRGQIQADDFIREHPQAAAQDANAALTKALGNGLEPETLTASFAETTFTNDPDMRSLSDQAAKAIALGFLEPLDLDGIFDRRLLNEELEAAGKSTVRP